MIYTKTLPQVSELRQLALNIRDFPITGLGIVQLADHLGYDEKVTDFIKLFSQGIVFNSRTDFLDHCSLLERLLKEEYRSVPEHLRSPQD